MTLTLPWPMWANAQPRPYPYGTWGFLAMLIIGIVYLTIMWIAGLLFLRTYRTFPQRVEYKYFGIAILTVAFFDSIHVLGDILFYLTNDSRVLIQLGADVAFYLYPTATSLSVTGVFIAFSLIYAYSVHKLGEIKPIDYIFYTLSIVGIALGLNPYNWWHMIRPEGAFDTKPITGIFLLIVGIMSVRKFYVSLKAKLGPELEKLPAGAKRIKLVTIALVLLLLLVFLMMPHGMLAALATQVEWAKIAMIIVTYIKLLSLATSAILLYSGLVWPNWAQKIFGP
ncbi:MAG: hypothetical protein QXE21_05420 [Candidatus Korarchaeota archaeon]|nr:hypothetical protein [Thermoproteota archaeon]